MTKKPANPAPDARKKDLGADQSEQPATLVAGGPESEGRNRKVKDARDATPPAGAPPADAPTPPTHRKGVQPLSGTTD